jgi:hypothetical protein
LSILESRVGVDCAANFGDGARAGGVQDTMPACMISGLSIEVSRAGVTGYLGHVGVSYMTIMQALCSIEICSTGWSKRRDEEFKLKVFGLEVQHPLVQPSE